MPAGNAAETSLAPAPWALLWRQASNRLIRLSGHPVRESEIAPDLSALVPVAHRLLGIVIGFGKSVLRVSNGFTDGLE